MSSDIGNRMSFNFRFSSKFYIASACFICSMLFLLFQGGKLASMLFIIVAILCLYLGLGKWNGIASMKGSRMLQNVEEDGRIKAGTSLSVKIVTQIPGFWPIPYVLVNDSLIRRHGKPLIFHASYIPDWKRRGEVTYTTPPLRRGLYRFEQTECATEDIFGIFQYKGSFIMRQSFSVMPQTVSIAEWSLLHQMAKGTHHHSITARAIRETTQINGVREYIYGDRISRIHWNATAKTGNWKSKEFERESLPKTIIILDRCIEHYKNMEQFELAVSVIASLFEYASREELALGLLSSGADTKFFDSKKRSVHFNDVMNHLIDVDADGKFDLPQIVRSHSRDFIQGSFIAIVSPACNEAMLSTIGWLNRKQMNPCHLWLDEDLKSPEQEEWFRQLKGKGCAGFRVASLHELSSVLGGRA